jgi:hypothetical protein
LTLIGGTGHSGLHFEPLIDPNGTDPGGGARGPKRFPTFSWGELLRIRARQCVRLGEERQFPPQTGHHPYV